MVNRILIRTKVVQLLYSYLLTRTEFKIDMEPDISSADKKFAHVAYVDLLMLLLELTGHSSDNNNKVSRYAIEDKLASSMLGNALAKDMNIRELMFKSNHNLNVLAPAIQQLHDRIAASTVFNDYKRKRKIDLTTEVSLWTVLFESVIATDPKLIEAFRTIPGFTAIGLQMAIAKVVSTIKSFEDARTGYYTALKNLDAALDKSYELYLSMFKLIIELTREQSRRLEGAKTKFLATSEDLNPNTRFVDNVFAAALENSKELEELTKNRAINWDTDITLISSLLDSITASDIYKQYMKAPSTDWAKDCDFWRQVLKNILMTSDDLTEALEDMSVYWNDDLQIMGTFVLKTIRRAESEPAGTVSFLPKFKDDEDASFGAELFEKSVNNREKYRSYIDRFINTENWDTDRLAYMDIIIMIVAIAEIIGYPSIPLPVTFNEYIDIANSYSSPKSGQFINGILYNVVNYLKAEGIIVK